MLYANDAMPVYACTHMHCVSSQSVQRPQGRRHAHTGCRSIDTAHAHAAITEALDAPLRVPATASFRSPTTQKWRTIRAGGRQVFFDVKSAIKARFNAPTVGSGWLLGRFSHFCSVCLCHEFLPTKN